MRQQPTVSFPLHDDTRFEKGKLAPLRVLIENAFRSKAHVCPGAW